MMRVRMTKNLGSRDAARVELDQSACVEGEVVNVSEDAAAWLVRAGLATAVEDAAEKPEKQPEKPAEVVAVPNEPVAAKPRETLKGVTRSPKGKK